MNAYSALKMNAYTILYYLLERQYKTVCVLIFKGIKNITVFGMSSIKERLNMSNKF